MDIALKILAIIVLSFIGILCLKQGSVLTLADHVGLWCITCVGFIVARIKP
jgi:hypothetical protein